MFNTFLAKYQFIGYAVMNPHIMAICIINQYTAVILLISGVKKTKKTNPIQMYIPTCHAITDSKSA